MSESLIKRVFGILGILVITLVAFEIIFGAAGQNLMWNAIEPAMQSHWNQITLNNGADRSSVYEKMFNEVEDYN